MSAFDNLSDQFKPGDRPHFEYHCYEGHDSADAQLWYHSHQQATVQRRLGPDEVDEEETGPMYQVRFDSGLEGHVNQHELMHSPKDFYRPDPPRPK